MVRLHLLLEERVKDAMLQVEVRLVVSHSDLLPADGGCHLSSRRVHRRPQAVDVPMRGEETLSIDHLVSVGTGDRSLVVPGLPPTFDEVLVLFHLLAI